MWNSIISVLLLTLAEILKCMNGQAQQQTRRACHMIVVQHDAWHMVVVQHDAWHMVVVHDFYASCKLGLTITAQITTVTPRVAH